MPRADVRRSVHVSSWCTCRSRRRSCTPATSCATPVTTGCRA